jgi:hypothetical protein
VDDLELEAVRVVEEHGVVAGDVVVLGRRRLDLGAALDEPAVPFLDRLA